jgi:hypothetical protein
MLYLHRRHRSTFYTFDEVGYTDYPLYAPAAVAV